jgi:hypothetical protein
VVLEVPVTIGEVVPVVNKFPPVAASYHRTLLALAPGVAVMEPLVPHTTVLVAVGTEGSAPMVSVTAERVPVSQEVVEL